ncbi:MAG: YbaY family lipoprotein [Chloroflexi bacterium]|nr:YbaY family lipoprotein [Chloroflexota bacterium]
MRITEAAALPAGVQSAVCFLLCLLIMLLAAACRGEPLPANATTEIPSGREGNAAVTGTVTYRERLALTPGATLIVELRDVSYADAAAPLIARQTIPDPGQVPIRFRVEYNRADIDDRNVYAIQAEIIESDGRLAFINDTAYDVITRGNPSSIDMLLVIVEPPPELVAEAGEDWRTWVETPVPVVWANRIPNEPDHFLRVAYYQSTIEGCARPGSESLDVQGHDIIARVTLMQPPPTGWSIPCDEQVVELDTVLPITAPLDAGPTYRVIVNERAVTTFTLPASDLPHTFIAESPIESAEVVAVGSAPASYDLRVVSGLPAGGSCSQFNGYEVRRDLDEAIEVVITHHEVADPDVVCTADYPIIETTVPLGSDFEPGIEYTVVVNGETRVSFAAGAP